MEFEFVSDKAFQEILKRDYQELKRCQAARASKSVLILSGSIVEALLSDYFSENLPAQHTKQSILNATLSSLLDLAEAGNIISPNDKNLATVIRNFRNLIHPGVEIRKGEHFDTDVAEIAISVLELLLKRIQNKYKETFPTTAEEIIEKLDEDHSFHSVYGISITKLSSNEKNKLFEEFIEVDDDLKRKWENFEDPAFKPAEYLELYTVKAFVNELKPLLTQQFIIHNLQELGDLITKGEGLDVFVRYNLLHEELVMLPPETQEMIAIYMLSFFSKVIENSRELADEKTYSTIGKYIHTNRGLSQLKELIEYAVVNFDHRDFEYQFNVLEQITNSLTDVHRQELERHFQSFIEPILGSPANELNELIIVREFETRNLFKLVAA